MTDLIARLRLGLPQELPARLGVAVSGGGDSMALLSLLMALPNPPELCVATVDHGLRQGSDAEADQVAQTCRGFGIAHETLRWNAGPPAGNLQAQARTARYDLLADWAARLGLPAVVLGHTQDDQAETVLMRLGRGSGVTGLSAMRASRRDRGVTWLRPLLNVTRAELRDWLRSEGLGWIDDPSNEDPRFDRIRVRQSMEDLAALGVSRDALANVAGNLARAEDALAYQTARAAGYVGRVHLGDILLERAGLAAEPEEIARRLILRAITCVTGPGYPPRSDAVLRVLADVLEGRSATLAGCLFLSVKGHVRVTREYRSVQAHQLLGCVWDRWHLRGLGEGDRVTALGADGLAQLPDWRATGAPREALIASPAVWQGAKLVAAPVAGWANGRDAVAIHALEWITLPQSH